MACRPSSCSASPVVRRVEGDLTAKNIRKWAALHWIEYDTQFYEPFIASARTGDPHALRKVTEWKNLGKGDPPRPIPFAKNKNKEPSFQRFLGKLPNFLAEGGSAALRTEFKDTAPVWAIFWHHVLFQTPIIDVHTNRAFQFFKNGRLLKGDKAKIPRGGHWSLYDRYSEWFYEQLKLLQKQDPGIDERMLDRGLMQWGIANS